LFLLAAVATLGQNLPKGAMTYKVSGKKTNVVYSRTLSSRGDTAFITRYAVFAPGSDTLYRIWLLHNPGSKSIRSMASSGSATATSAPASISYKFHNSGLIMNQVSLADTGIDVNKTYDWMVFHADTSRTYLSACNLTLADSVNLTLDKLPKGILLEHSRISKSLLAAPALVKIMQRQDRQLSGRIKQLEASTASGSNMVATLSAENSKLKSDLNALREKNSAMAGNYDSLCHKVYRLSYAPNAYATTQKEAWDLKVDSLLYKHAHENYFENTDVKFTIKIQTDSNGVVTATDLVFPASVSALSSKDSYILTVLTGIIKKETFAPNKIDVYGKTYAVKTYLEKELFISVKNRKEKVLYTDKDNVAYNETKLPLPQDVKDQFNAKMYAGAKAGKYGAQIMSFTVNKLTKEVVKTVDF